MTGDAACPLCNGSGMVTATERRKKKWVKIPQTPCFCVRKKEWGRCGLCKNVVTGEAIGAALCEACADSIEDSTDLKKKA